MGSHDCLGEGAVAAADAAAGSPGVHRLRPVLLRCTPCQLPLTQPVPPTPTRQPVPAHQTQSLTPLPLLSRQAKSRGRHSCTHAAGWFERGSEVEQRSSVGSCEIESKGVWCERGACCPAVLVMHPRVFSTAGCDVVAMFMTCQVTMLTPNVANHQLPTCAATCPPAHPLPHPPT